MDDRGLWIMAIWSAALLLWLGFRLFYDGLRRPLRPHEIETFLAGLGARMDATGNDAARLRAFLEADDGREFVMLNLVKTRPGIVADPDSGEALGGAARSEEHTSELQSLMRISYAVFCLKKKKNRKT